MIFAGMGELHLEIIVDRLKREFNVEATVGTPQVAYKEALTRPADGEMKYAKQTGMTASRLSLRRVSPRQE